MNQQKFVNGTAGVKLAAVLAVNGMAATLPPGKGALFPALSAGDYYLITLATSANPETVYEVVKSSGATDDVLAITQRAVQGAAQEWAAGDKCECRLNANALNMLVPPSGSQTVIPGKPLVVDLPEGYVLTAVSNTATPGSGTVTRGGSADSWSVTPAKGKVPVGAFSGKQQLTVTCTDGAIDATVVGAAATAALGLSDSSGLQLPGGVVQKFRPVKKSRTLTRAFRGKISVGSNFAASAAHTFNALMEMSADFTAVRIAIPNLEASAIAGVTAAVAVTASAANISAPTVGNTLTNDMTTGFVQATFSGSNSVNLPARIAASIPSYTYSDWIPLRSLARSDGGTKPLLHIRICHPNGTPLFSYFTASASPDFAAFGGRYFKSSRQAVDGVANPAAFTSTNPTSTWALGLVQARSVRQSAVFACFGDSITEGQPGPSVDLNCWGLRAAAQLTADGLPVEFANFGWSGAITSDYYARAMSRLSEITPEIAYMSVWSPNDLGVTLAATYQMMDRALAFVSACESLGVIPALSTCVPKSGSGSGAFMTAVDVFVRDLAASGRVLMFDFRAVLDADPTAGGGSGSIKPAMSFDPTHPNDAGHAAMADEVVSKLRSYLLGA